MRLLAVILSLLFAISAFAESPVATKYQRAVTEMTDALNKGRDPRLYGSKDTGAIREKIYNNPGSAFHFQNGNQFKERSRLKFLIEAYKTAHPDSRN